MGSRRLRHWLHHPLRDTAPLRERQAVIAALAHGASRLRPDARNQTLRAPVQVMDGNYERMSGTCPWWDAVVRRG